MTFSLALAVFTLDRLTKWLVFDNFVQGQSIKLIPNVFHLTLVLNKGAAFGLFKDKNLIFIPFSILAILIILAYIWKRGSMHPLLSSSLGLILGGSAGNLVDRSRYGYVIDFLDFRIWPVFNVADSAISIGVALLVWNILRKKKSDPCIQ
jgi:signal peptidase II